MGSQLDLKQLNLLSQLCEVLQDLTMPVLMCQLYQPDPVLVAKETPVQEVQSELTLLQRMDRFVSSKSLKEQLSLSGRAESQKQT